MLLYHGSGCRCITTFDFEHCKSSRDFGQGVYLTSNFDQAVKWSCHESEKGAVYECEIDLSSFSVFSYTIEDKDLYYILYLCRIGLEEIVPDSVDWFEKADIIAGPLLDGMITNFIDIADRFNEGDISECRFIGNVKQQLFDGTFDQYCIKSQRALDAMNASIQRITLTEKTADGIRTKINGLEKQIN